MQKFNSERGMSLVEATIILMVLFILTAVFTPTLGEYVEDARQVKAKEDVEAIGTTLKLFLKDVNMPFPVIDPAATLADRYKKANRVEMLVTAGNTPTGFTADFTSAEIATTHGVSGDMDWDIAIGATNGVELLEDHMVDNTANYSDVGFLSSNVTGGPRTGIGWRGPYLGFVGSDPWGNRYAVNTTFLAAATDATATAKGWLEDVVVISAGNNGSVQTNFGNQEYEGSGDDIAYLIQGATR